ncbi:MAG: SDR family NAD(P)-dependent oxidoreductase [Candidatus Binatia bacterium]
MGTSVALVTGASSGIGADFARQLAAEGSDVVAVARRADRLAELKSEIEGRGSARCHVIAMDLSRPEAPGELHRETERLGLEVDWLVNNAGFGTSGAFATLPLERENEEIQLNVIALVALTRLYLPGMLARGRGYVVNLGSIGSFVPTPYMATYSATKAFILSFSEAVATEVAGKGVNVLALCPGATKTEFQEVAGVAEAIPEFTFMTSQAVVRQAIAAVKAGKHVLVPGWMNKVTAMSTRLTPRTVLAKVAGSMFAPKNA